jgi:phosphoenolpyruvate synthase/pyruvate phosphate dikinase
MTLPSLECLKTLVQENEWVQGAVNYDEDLHFSSFYLRASHARHTAPLYPGYTSILAFYEGFNECYYLLKNECRDIAIALVTRAIRQPTWLHKILGAIRRQSDALAKLFPTEASPAWMAELSDAAIVALYQKHAARNRTLYKYARLPEALDRGDGYFSAYLKEYLCNLGLSAAASEETFTVLTQPEVPSVLAQEILEFDQIVQQVQPDKQLLASCSSGRARMALRPEDSQRLRAHHEKWKYLHYHGYGRRELATLGQYIERLLESMNKSDGEGHASGVYHRASQARQQRQKVLKTLRLDRAHRALFAAYPEIGAVKLYRRYAQLRNFYYLDMLLAEIAERISVSEWTLRCMLPEEIVACLGAKKPVRAAILERGQGCMYALVGDQEQVVALDQASHLRQLLQAKTRGRHNGKVLHGTVACRGNVVGPCRVIIRADDHLQDFAKGSILVSESTDPDLMGFFQNAGGILTEQGGVTSHAAIICRELGIPTIVGIEGLLDRVRDGDVVQVDAQRGQVTLVHPRPAPPRGVVFSAEQLHEPDRIGAKACNLGRVRALGFAVPEFVVLHYKAVKRLLDHPSPVAGQRLVHWALEQLNLPADARIAVRSSARDEDRAKGSQAGAYRSLLNVGPDKMIAALGEFVRLNSVTPRGTRYRGSIILQRMIDADYAGVCLTADLRTGQGDTVIVELAAGGNQAVTQGHGKPDRVVVDRLTGDILENHRKSPRLSSGQIDIPDMVQQFLTLEAHFGKPLDIEWALRDRKLYILQARPISI